MTAPSRPHRFGAAALVLLVLGAGALIGLALTLLTAPLPGPPGPHGAPPPTHGLLLLSGTITGIDLALLLTLVGVYVRTFLDTRARFAAGLVVVLVALTLQTLVASPFVFGVFGLGPGGLWPFLFVSLVFGAVALAVFLYLSLE